MALEISRTEKPSTVVFCDRENDQFFLAHTRSGMLFPDFAIEIAQSVVSDVLEFDKKLQSTPADFGPKHFIKLRCLDIDDKNGSITLKVDYLHDQFEEPVFNEEQIKFFLKDGTVQDQGQGQWVEVRIKRVLCSSDYFSPVSDIFYE